MRPNSGKLIKAGSKYRVGHPLPRGRGADHGHGRARTRTSTRRGEEPKHRQVLASFSGIQGGNRNLDIPPNSLVVTENFHVMKQNGRIENFQPHLHLRGKGMQMEAILPNGTRQVLSAGERLRLQLAQQLRVRRRCGAAPAQGHGAAVQDLVPQHGLEERGNPDPNQWIGWGDRTVDEMGHAWVNVTYLTDDDFKAEVEKRPPTSRRRRVDNSSSGK